MTKRRTARVVRRVLLAIVLAGSMAPARSAQAQAPLDSNYVLLPGPNATPPPGEQPQLKVSVVLGPEGGDSPSLLEHWGDDHWLAELTPKAGRNEAIWLSVEKARFEPESLVSGIPVQLIQIGHGRIARWDGTSLVWSEYPYRFDIVSTNRTEALKVAQVFRSVNGKPRFGKVAGYATDGLQTVTSLRKGIRVRSSMSFQKSTYGSGLTIGLNLTMLDGKPSVLQKFARAIVAFPTYPYNFSSGTTFRSGASWAGGRSFGHWRLWFEEPDRLVFFDESKYGNEDIQNWVRVPVTNLEKSIEVKSSPRPMTIPIDVWSFAERSNAEPGADPPNISDLRLLTSGKSGNIRWEIRRDFDGSLLSRSGKNVVFLDGSGSLEDGIVKHQEGWLSLGNSFAYVQTVETATGPLVVSVNQKPVKRVYPKRLNDGSFLVIAEGILPPFPTAVPDVEFIAAE